MTRLCNQIALICLSLLLSASGAWALPECPSNPAAFWSNCVGTYNYTNGSIYIGEYKDGERSGQGILTHANGEKYVGEFKDGKANGQGTYTYGSGATYVGEFKDGKANGQGTYTYASGATYVGYYKDDKRNGLGSFTYADGSTYVGEWFYNKRRGQGIYTHVDGTIKEGIWENDKFMYANKVEPPERVEFPALVPVMGYGVATSLRPIARPTPHAIAAEAKTATEPAPASVPDISDAVADALAAAVAASGTPAVQASPSLTATERDSFRLAVNSCWTIDLESVAASVVVKLGFTLKHDGTLDGDVRLLSSSSGDPSSTSEAFESARRAIWRCQGGGYQLPADKYDQWREIEITFDPRGMRMK